jgi:hypothetical protein
MLTLLGLASTGVAPAQAPSPTFWTLTSGAFTIFGHTNYALTSTLLPRVVYDTGRGLDSSRVVDSVRLVPPTRPGLAAGLNALPADLYCSGVTSATAQPLDPRVVLERVQLAAKCGLRLVVVPPRRFLTTSGVTTGEFSVDSAMRLTDRFAAALPPDTLRKYRATLLGLNLADDYGCKECWGGQRISQAQIAEWAAYARTKLPGLPLGVRITADWVEAWPALAPLLDYTWAQYTTKRGDQQAYYDQAAATARRLKLRVVMGVSVESCYGSRTRPCTAADLLRYGTVAVTHPASCAFLNWRYKESTWQQADVREAWERLLTMARARPAQECRRQA